MWYKFYASDSGAPEHEDYFYFEEYEGDPDNEELLSKEALQENWSLWTAQIGFGMGLGFNPEAAEYERVTALPEDVHQRKIRHYDNAIDDAQRMIDVLLATPVAGEEGAG